MIVVGVALAGLIAAAVAIRYLLRDDEPDPRFDPPRTIDQAHDAIHQHMQCGDWCAPKRAGLRLLVDKGVIVPTEQDARRYTWAGAR